MPVGPANNYIALFPTDFGVDKLKPFFFYSADKQTQRRNSFIRGPLVRFDRGPYLYIFIKSHMLINCEVNIVLLS